MSTRTARPFWDWNDPRIRSYRLFKTKMVVTFVLGGVVLGVFGYFVGDATEGAVLRVSSLVVVWIVGFPFLVAGIIANIKRLAEPEVEREPDGS